MKKTIAILPTYNEALNIQRMTEAVFQHLPGAHVLIVDDLLATGGTVQACCQLLEHAHANIVGCAFLVALDALGGAQRIAPHEAFSLIHY